VEPSSEEDVGVENVTSEKKKTKTNESSSR
jgi:hypothetical protein